jgi:hypothetical protein
MTNEERVEKFQQLVELIKELYPNVIESEDDDDACLSISLSTEIEYLKWDTDFEGSVYKVEPATLVLPVSWNDDVINPYIMHYPVEKED